MKYPRGGGPFLLGPWPDGINNVEAPEDVPESALVNSEDMVLDDDGQLRVRPGLVQRLSATNLSGLFAVDSQYGLFFDNGSLKRFDARSWNTPVTLDSGYSSGFVSWQKIGPRIFFTNGKEHGRIHVPTWTVLEGFGTPTPTLNVTLTALSYGSLPIGRYFVAITYVDSFGEESGSPDLNFIELTAVGGISVSLSGTVPDSVSEIRLYMTEVNGKRDELYRVQVLDDDETATEITFREFGSPLETLFLDEIPVPELITLYNGHLYFSVENRVWHSHPLRYGLYHIDHNELGAYPSDVTVLAGGQSEVYVVADRTYAYVGQHPKDFALKDDCFNYGAVKYSGTQIESNLFKLESSLSGDVPYWFTERGAVLGLPGGQVMPVSKGRAEPDEYAVGVSGTVEFNGVESVMTALDERKGPNDSMSLQDSFTVKVIKRGLNDA